MKVCLVTGEYPPMRGGVADYTHFLAEALARYGAETSIITSEKVRVSHSQASSALRADVSTVPNWGHRGIGQAVEIIRAIRPDVVHVQYQAGAFDLNAAISTLPWRLRARSDRPRTVVTFHDLKVPYLFPKAGPLRRLANAALVYGADAVVATNAEDAARLAFPAAGGGDVERALRFGPRLARVPIGSNIPVSPPAGFDRAQWRSRLGVAPDQLLLSYFGFLVPTKGVDVLVAALRELRRRGCGVKLAMIGGSSADLSVSADRSYEQLIRQQTDQPDLRGSVLWTGFTGREEVSANLLASDVCVLPFREGASLRHGTLIAAIAHGLPIVTTAAPAVPRLREGLELLSGVNCLLTAVDDPSAIVDAIEKLASSPELRVRLADGARRLGEGFRWDAIARQSLLTYQAILGGGTARFAIPS